MSKGLDDIINFAKFHIGCSGRLEFTRTRNLHVAIENAIGPYHIAKRYRAGK
jgi:hypothetical protein